MSAPQFNKRVWGRPNPARWRARRDRALAARRHHRTAPIRANRPRGISRLDPRIADLTEVVLDLHYFAREAQHDTS